MLAKLDAPVGAARRSLETAQAAAKATPAKIPLSQHNPDIVRLDAETKLITHAIRMAAYNAETTLARALGAATPAPATRHTPSSAKPSPPAATSSPATAP